MPPASVPSLRPRGSLLFPHDFNLGPPGERRMTPVKNECPEAKPRPQPGHRTAGAGCPVARQERAPRHAKRTFQPPLLQVKRHATACVFSEQMTSRRVEATMGSAGFVSRFLRSLRWPPGWRCCPPAAAEAMVAAARRPDGHVGHGHQPDADSETGRHGPACRRGARPVRRCRAGHRHVVQLGALRRHGLLDGPAAALAGGSVVATATISGVSGSLSLTVTPRVTTTVAVTSPSVTPQIGETLQLTAVARDQFGDTIPGGPRPGRVRRPSSRPSRRPGSCRRWRRGPCS